MLGELRRAVATGEFTAGDPLRQDALAERFGVSRVPVREALKILEAEGQVVYAPHRGYRMAQLSLADLLEVYRLRDLLEGEAARVAVERAGDDVGPAMEQAAREVEAASDVGDLAAMTEANRRFHFLLITAAGMPRLERLVRVLWDATDTYRLVYYGSEDSRRLVHHEHALILRAFADRDPDELAGALQEHRRHAVEMLRRLLKDG